MTPGSNSDRGKRLFSKTSRQTTGLSQRHAQWVPGSYPVINPPKRDVQSPPHRPPFLYAYMAWRENSTFSFSFFTCRITRSSSGTWLLSGSSQYEDVCKHVTPYSMVEVYRRSTHTSLSYSVAINKADMRRFTTGIRSKKCVGRQFRRRANVYLTQTKIVQYSVTHS
jgi:hypothetical protein